MQLDSVQIGVPDAADVRVYAILLGTPAIAPAGGARRFQLHGGAVELEAGGAGLHSLRFVVEPRDRVATLSSADFNGLRLRFDAAADTSPPNTDAVAEAIDHVVIHSPDLDRAITLWRDHLGLRLALDRTFLTRSLRILFFRSAGITVEVVGALPAPAEPAGPDTFYGIAYRVTDLDGCRARLLDASVDVSEPRTGQKPGTVVATVRSGTAGVPTLLVAQAATDGTATGWGR